MNKKDVEQILGLAAREGRHLLLENEAKGLLECWGLPVARTQLARSLDEAVKISNQIGFPVVLKIASPDIIHKSDAKCVKVNLGSEHEVRSAFEEIVANAKAYKQDANILGVVVQEFVPKAREVIVGALQDPSFGPTVMFGMGGIFVEVLKDVSFRLAPLTPEDAREMISEIKGYPILAGVRGEKPADIEALVEILQKVGQLAYEFTEIAEMDLNPIFVFDKGEGAKIVDARIVLK
jgi:acyl-CoA synthetase (NDP forming)